jgi:hypothetical protein
MLMTCPTQCRWLIGLALWLAVGESWAQGPLTFTDVTTESGVRFLHTDGSSGRHYIVESFTGGLALFDFDQDGDLDIYFLNGSPLPSTDVDKAKPSALYRNDGDWKFTDVTNPAGLGRPGYAMGVCAADYDNDGFADLYVSNFGPNVLYRNNGDGTFTDYTDRAGVAIGPHVGAGACFVDIEADGDLDLYAANYIDYSLEQHRPHVHKGVPAYPSPLKHSPVADFLFRNNGDGTFADASRESGIAAHLGYGMGVVACDYDGDGDQDIFVANDVQANFLWQNDGLGKFSEVGLLAGTALDLAGKAQASMGVDAADFDNDGRMDFHVTSYAGEFATLYRNLGRGLFEDATRVARSGESTLPHVKWGNAFADFDNDGWRDLLIACGHLDDNIHLRGGRGATAFEVASAVLRNLGSGRFRDVTAETGDGLKRPRSTRGAAAGDLDGDGDPDLVLLNSRAAPALIRNDTLAENRWLIVQLVGRLSNRSAVGALVKVHVGGAIYSDEVRSGRGYQSDFGQQLHFGLGRAPRANKVEIRWPSGRVSALSDVASNQTMRLVEEDSGPP